MMDATMLIIIVLLVLLLGGGGGYYGRRSGWRGPHYGGGLLGLVLLILLVLWLTGNLGGRRLRLGGGVYQTPVTAASVNMATRT
jgi:Protein of unknown function (DUF3309)